MFNQSLIEKIKSNSQKKLILILTENFSFKKLMKQLPGVELDESLMCVYNVNSQEKLDERDILLIIWEYNKFFKESIL